MIELEIDKFWQRIPISPEYGAPTRLVQVAGRWRDIRMVETYPKPLQAEKIQPYSVVNRLMGFQERRD
jgi:hypothetical protein